MKHPPPDRRIRFRTVLLPGISILLMVTVYLSGTRKCDGLSCVHSPYLNRFTKTAPASGDSDGLTAVYTNGSSRLTIRSRPVASRAKAREIMQTYQSDVRGMYEVIRAPYPGQISREVVCNKSFQPDESGIAETPDSMYMSLRGPASAGGVFGICDASEAAASLLTELLYCPNRRMLYTIEITAPPGKEGHLPMSTNPVCR